MERAIAILRQEYASRGLHFDDAIDPNHTGLVGPEYTDITTTLGSVEAKRTTTNPNIAGVIVHLLQEAGVQAGDTVAVGCSASFPALLIATLAAAEAMDVHPVVILSLGSSSYGATRSDFTVLDICEVLMRKGFVNIPPVAVSLGGAGDIGRDYEPETRDRLIGRIRKVGIPFLYEPDLQRNVAQRMALYFGPTLDRRITAFVNIGGSYAELGTSPLVLKLEPGVNTYAAIPAANETHGVVFEMMEHHIAVIHLLHIKSLAMKYGLPWDPIPLAQAGALGKPQAESTLRTSAEIIAAVYFSLLALIFVLHRKAFFPKLP
jgi:poly-gamma-glutamate system protein